MLCLKRSGKIYPKVLYVCGIGLVLVGAFILEHGSKESKWQKKTSFVGPGHPILVVAFSSDGEHLASGDTEGDLFIWGWNSDTPLAIYRGLGQGQIPSIAFSPDGRSLVAGCTDGTARIWSVPPPKSGQTSYSDEPIRKLDAKDSGLVGVCFSPDGKTLATASATGTIRLWDANLGTVSATWQTHQFGIFCLAFNPDGKTLATGSLDHSIVIWDVGTGKAFMSLPKGAASIKALAYSGNGKNLVSASSDGAVKIWDAADGTPIETLRATDPLLLSVGMTTDGRKIIVGGLEGVVNFWDLDKGNEPVAFRHYQEPWYKAVALTPDGTRLAFGMNSDFSVEGWELRPTRGSFLR
jgi:WD40 repeat protein